MNKYIVDGSKVIMKKQSMETRTESFEFVPHEVYNLYIGMSTGDGKAIKK